MSGGGVKIQITQTAVDLGKLAWAGMDIAASEVEGTRCDATERKLVPEGGGDLKSIIKQPLCKLMV